MIKNEYMTNVMLLQPYRTNKKDIEKCCAKTTTCQDESSKLEALCPAELYTINKPLSNIPFQKVQSEIIKNCCEKHNEEYDTCENFIRGGLVCEEDKVPTRNSEKLTSKIRASEFDNTCCEQGFNCGTMRDKLAEKCADKFPIPDETGLVHEDDVVSECCREGKSCNEYICSEDTLPRKDIDDKEKKRPQESLQDDCCIRGQRCPQSLDDLNKKCEEDYKKIGKENAEKDMAVSISSVRSCLNVKCEDIDYRSLTHI